MTKFNKKTRQRIVDEYLHASGKNHFISQEFVDWVAQRPEHEYYGTLFDKSDAERANQSRVDQVNQMISGLRITVTEEVKVNKEITFRVTEYPSYISPVARRKSGGGYDAFDPHNPADQQELRRQAGTALASWLNRFRGCAEHNGINVSPIQDIAETLRDDIV
jgi:hypothetical protein|tara:strand:+ start:606 stop:1094 length:489 start_codon:yes stop_codon:yes gene_type:complete